MYHCVIECFIVSLNCYLHLIMNHSLHTLTQTCTHSRTRIHTHTHTYTHTPHAVDAYQQVAEAFAEVLSPGTPTPTPTPAPAGVPEPAGGVWLYEKGNASDVFLRYR